MKPMGIGINRLARDIAEKMDVIGRHHTIEHTETESFALLERLERMERIDPLNEVLDPVSLLVRPPYP